jgi:hypothetical protein
MSAQLSRETVFRGGISVPGLRVRARYQERDFEPQFLTETLREQTRDLPGGDTEVTEVYSVTITGPIILKSGREHATQSGEQWYSTRQFGDNKMDELPEQVKPFLSGPDELRRVTIVRDGR